MALLKGLEWAMGKIDTPWVFSDTTRRFDVALDIKQDWDRHEVSYPAKTVNNNATIDWRAGSPNRTQLAISQNASAATTIDFKYQSTGEYKATVDWNFEVELNRYIDPFWTGGLAEVTVYIVADLQPVGTNPDHPDSKSLVFDVDFSHLLDGVLKDTAMRQEEGGVFRLGLQMIGRILSARPLLLRVGFRYDVVWVGGSPNTLTNIVSVGIDFVGTAARNVYRAVLAGEHEEASSPASGGDPHCDFEVV